MDDQPLAGAPAPPGPASAEPIHEHFGLSYANYLVLHRTLLQSMPLAWQRQFVALLAELDEAYAHLDFSVSVRVQPVDAGGRYACDPVPHYDRGRAFVPPRRPAAGGQSGVRWPTVFGSTGWGRSGSGLAGAARAARQERIKRIPGVGWLEAGVIDVPPDRG